MIAPETLMTRLCDLAIKAGTEIMDVYRSDFDVSRKDDRSPVTEADTRAEAVILKALADETLGLGHPVVSEEAFADGHAPDIGNGPFWVVDPMDGTRDFIERNDEFTVNIGLVERDRPLLGVIYAPALDALYWTNGKDAFRRLKGGTIEPIRCRPAPADGLEALVSRHHCHGDTIAYLERLGPTREKAAGSSYKFCLIAAGEADIYPRFGRTMEWDTGAGHAILQAAGGHVTTIEGQPFVYGKPGFANGEFIARGAFDLP